MTSRTVTSTRSRRTRPLRLQLGRPGRLLAGLTTTDFQRLAGWFMLVSMALALAGLSDVGLQGPVGLLLGTGLLAGLWLVVRASGFIGMSRSTRHLLAEGRSRRRLAAHHLHHRPWPGRSGQPLSPGGVVAVGLVSGAVAAAYAWLAMGIQQSSWQLLFLLLPALFCMSYAMAAESSGLLAWVAAVAYAILLFATPSYLSLLSLPLLSLALVWYLVPRRRWGLLLLASLASSLLLLEWAFVYQVSPLLVLAVGLLMVTVLFLPLTTLPRRAEERGVIGMALALGGLSYAWLLATLQGEVEAASWLDTALALILLLAYGAYLSWLRHGSASYAKYFLFLGVFSTAILALALGSAFLTCLLWFMLSVLLLGLGFAASSYGARLGGLALLIASLAYYLATVLPYPLSMQGSPGKEAVGLGVLFVLFLPVLAAWYGDLPVHEPDVRHRLVVQRGLYLASLALGLCLLYLVSGSLTATLSWLCLIFLLVVLVAATQIKRLVLPR